MKRQMKGSQKNDQQRQIQYKFYQNIKDTSDLNK